MRTVKIIAILCLFALSACHSKKVQADSKLVCLIERTMDATTYTSTIEVEYSKKENTLIHGMFHKMYQGIDRRETNNEIFQEFMEKKRVLEDVEGVQIELDITDTKYDYKEEWNYLDAVIEKDSEVEDDQKDFIEEGKYQIDKIESYHVLQGYLCEVKAIN